MIDNYRTGRSICGFVEFIAWAGVVLCGIALLMTFGTTVSVKGGALALIAVVPILIGLMVCFVVILIAQLARATMDGSVATQIMAQDGRRQHAELIAAVGLSRATPSRETRHPSFEDRVLADRPIEGVPLTAKPNENYQVYSGFRVYSDGMGVRVGDRKFHVITAANAYIEELKGMEQRIAHHGYGEIDYRNTAIVFNDGAFETRGRTFTALHRAANFLDDQFEQVEAATDDEEPIKLVPDPSPDSSASPVLVADRRPPPGLG